MFLYIFIGNAMKIKIHFFLREDMFDSSSLSEED